MAAKATIRKPKADRIRRKTEAEQNEPRRNIHESIELERIEIGSLLVTKDLSDSEREFLALAQMIYRSDRGCTTPFENFITGLIVADGETYRYPEPAEVLRSVKEYGDDFDDILRISKKFADHIASGEWTGSVHRSE